MKLTKQEFDKKYENNELTNIEIFDTIFYLFKKVSELEELENRSCERCKYSFDIFTGLDDSFLGEDFICTKLEVDKVFEKDFYCSKYEPKQ